MTSKNTLCLWYDKHALEAATFYASIFPDSEVKAVHRAPGDYPSCHQGDVLTVEFTVLGIPCLGLNGGPAFPHSEAFSLQVATDDKEETDRLWNAIVGNSGRESECGWCKEKRGLNWQIAPRAVTAAITDPEPAAAKWAYETMMTLGKINIATIEAARLTLTAPTGSPWTGRRQSRRQWRMAARPGPGRRHGVVSGHLPVLSQCRQVACLRARNRH